MAHRFARSARLLAFSPGRAAAAAALPAALCAQQAKAEANEDINKETVAAAAAAAAVGYAAVAATQANAKAKDAQESLKALEVRAAKATSALALGVFVKPHAVTDSVKTKVKSGLEKAGISVLEEGSIAGPKIDSDMLIDTHYGAIAAKAVKLKPSELKPSAKAQKDFEKAFGLTWSDALKQGLVYNAADACKQLGCDGAGLDAKWSTLTRGQNLIKFGGGFYCGKVEGIYVMNGFYMAMGEIYRSFGHYSLLLGRVAHCVVVGRTSGAKCWAPRTPPRLPRVLCGGRSWTTGARSACRRARTRATTASTRRRRPSRRFRKSELVRGVLRDGRLRPRPRRGGRRRQDIASVGRGPSSKTARRRRGVVV